MVSFGFLPIPRFLALLLVALLLFTAAPAMAITFTEDFDGAALSPNLSTSAGAGFSATLGGGVLTFSEQAGFANGSAAVITNFSVLGDFTATVSANRAGIGAAEAGLATFHGGRTSPTCSSSGRGASTRISS
jgi:hypothetical protein